MTKQNSQFTYNIVNKTIDKLLRHDISIMFERQATYLYLLKLDNLDKKELYNRIKERAAIHHLNFNSGVLSKELGVANLCREHWKEYFNNINITDKTTDNNIKDIAKIMIDNNLTYNKLKNLIVNNPVNKNTIKKASYESVMLFLEVATDSELKQLKTFIESRLNTQKDKKQVKKAA